MSQLQSWWLAHKLSLFDVDSGLSPLSCLDDPACYNSKDKASLLALIFDNNQNDDIFSLPSSCNLPIDLHSLVFRSSKLLCYLNYSVDSLGGCDPLGFLPIFIRKLPQS